MFIGHFAVGFAAKKAAPEVSLGTLFLADQLLDLIWPILLLLGIEHAQISPGFNPFMTLDFYDYPFSHSLLAAVFYSIIVGGIYYFIRHYPIGAWILALGVVSHWILDFVTHRPDLPLAPGHTIYLGLGLWKSVTGTIVVEGVLYLIGVIIYLRSTIVKDRTGRIACWTLIFFLAFMWIANIVGPPPPDDKSVAIASLMLWLLVPWGYWIDMHRKNRNGVKVLPDLNLEPGIPL